MTRFPAVLLLVTISSPALAASVVATPALRPPGDGGVSCVISNASNSKPITVEWGLYDFNSNAVWGPSTITLQPLRNVRTEDVPVQSACVVKMVSGSKKSLRVALYAEDSSGDIVAAVNGQ